MLDRGQLLAHHVVAKLIGVESRPARTDVEFAAAIATGFHCTKVTPMDGAEVWAVMAFYPGEAFLARCTAATAACARGSLRPSRPSSRSIPPPPQRWIEEAMNTIPVKMQTVDCQTGKVTAFGILPAPPGTCPDCAVDHKPDQPHNQQSLFYQYSFYGRCKRWPTWHDAMAHCPPDIRSQWIAELAKKGVEVKAPATAEESA